MPGRAGPGTLHLTGDQQQAATGRRQAVCPDTAGRAARGAFLQPSVAPCDSQSPSAQPRSGTGTGLAVPSLPLEPEGFGCAITASQCREWESGQEPSCDFVFPAPDSAESLKSPSLLSRDTLQLIPKRVEVKLESTSVVLSMNSQKR